MFSFCLYPRRDQYTHQWALSELAAGTNPPRAICLERVWLPKNESSVIINSPCRFKHIWEGNTQMMLFGYMVTEVAGWGCQTDDIIHPKLIMSSRSHVQRHSLVDCKILWIVFTKMPRLLWTSQISLTDRHQHDAA